MNRIGTLLTPRKWIALMVYAGICITITLVYHEPWRDEFQLWLIAINSESLQDLFRLRYTESHPVIWHLFLFLLSKITHDFIIVQLLNLVFSILLAGLILSYSRLKFYQVCLLLCSYYFLFEYPVIARNYALGLLAIVGAILLIYKNKLIPATLLAIIATNVNLFSCIVILYVFLFFYLERSIKTGHLLAIFLGVALCLLDIYVQSFVNWQFGNDFKWANLFSFELIAHRIGLIFRSFVAVPDVFNLHFWNTNVVNQLPAPYQEYFLLFAGIGITGLLWGVFKNNRKIQVLCLVGTINLLLVFLFFTGGSQRHWGHFFILALIFYHIYLVNNPTSGWSSTLLNSFLVTQVIGSMIALYNEVNFQFSNSKNVAQYISDQYEPQDILITGAPDYTLTPVVGQLGDSVQFFSLQSNKLASFVDWNRPEQYFFNLDSVAYSGKRIILVAGRLNFSSGNKLEVQHLSKGRRSFTMEKVKTFDGAIVADENYDVYEISFE